MLSKPYIKHQISLHFMESFGQNEICALRSNINEEFKNHDPVIEEAVQTRPKRIPRTWTLVYESDTIFIIDDGTSAHGVVFSDDGNEHFFDVNNPEETVKNLVLAGATVQTNRSQIARTINKKIKSIARFIKKFVFSKRGAASIAIGLLAIIILIVGIAGLPGPLTLIASRLGIDAAIESGNQANDIIQQPSVEVIDTVPTPVEPPPLPKAEDITQPIEIPTDPEFLSVASKYEDLGIVNDSSNLSEQEIVAIEYMENYNVADRVQMYKESGAFEHREMSRDFIDFIITTPPEQDEDILYFARQNSRIPGRIGRNAFSLERLEYFRQQAEGGLLDFVR